jgi:hypothetical protein
MFQRFSIVLRHPSGTGAGTGTGTGFDRRDLRPVAVGEIRYDRPIGVDNMKRGVTVPKLTLGRFHANRLE